MDALEHDLDSLVAAQRFSGVVRVDRPGDVVLEKAYGLADRAHGIANRPDTQFGIASGLKSMTALAVVSLVEDGRLALDTPARDLLRDDLPHVADEVTVEQLLAHRSGIWDYLDEDADGEITDYAMPVPVHRLVGPEDYVAILDGQPAKFGPGTDFSYCNGGYVVLALLAERASGVPYHELVLDRVCRPAGMTDTAFLRSDELPARAALGYLHAEGPRTNVLHLPVRGTGDGGIYTTAADLRSFWTAFSAGRLVSEKWVAEMTRPRSLVDDRRHYGLGFWLRAGTPIVMLEGYDAGVSFRSLHDASRDRTCTVIANWSDGAWKIVGPLEELVFA